MSMLFDSYPLINMKLTFITTVLYISTFDYSGHFIKPISQSSSNFRANNNDNTFGGLKGRVS